MVKDRGRAFTVLRSLVGTGGEDTRCLPSQDQKGRIRTYQLAGSFISLALIVLLGSKIEWLPFPYVLYCGKYFGHSLIRETYARLKLVVAMVFARPPIAWPMIIYDECYN